MKLFLNINANDKKFLNYFKKKLFFKIISLNNNFNLKNYLIPTKQYNKTITILKSPHVNKKAQEQFIFTKFKLLYCILIEKVGKFLKILKQINKKNNFNINLNVKFYMSKKDSNLLCINPDKLKIKNNEFSYLKIISIYGEFTLKKH